MRIGEYQPPLLNAAHAAQPAASPGTSRPAPAAPATGRTDRVQVSANPFEGFAPSAASVTVDRWRKGPNDSIERILRRQGYSLDEIYQKGAGGQRLIERVAQANGLRDPNMIRPGSKLTVPSKQQPAEGAEQQQPAAAKPPAAPAQPPAAQAPAAQAPAAQAPAAQAPAAQVPASETAPTAPTPTQAPPAQAPAAQAPAAPAQPVIAGPTTPPANTNDNGGATVEIGLLLDGVNQKKFTRDEFQALNTTANQYTELRARSGKGGFTQEELATLGRVERQYGTMYTKFLEHDRSRIRFAGTDAGDAATRQRVSQLEEAGRTFDDLTAQRIDGETFITRLIAQRDAAKHLGEQ